MGARTFSPTAQSFLQSDRYAGAMDDLSLSTDSLTANRYALAAGNPVSFVEVDGHWPDFVDDAVDSAGDALSDAGDAVSEAAGDAWEASKDVGGAAFEAGKFVVGDDPLEIGLTVALTVGTGGTGLLVRTAAKAAIKGAVKAGGKQLLKKGANVVAGKARQIATDPDSTLGKGYRGLRMGVEKVRGAMGQTEVVQRVGSRAEAEATRTTGLVRGGREGTHWVSDNANSTALRARQRLSLGQTPEVRMNLEVKRGVFSRPTRVRPAAGQRGGGLERTARGAVRAKIRRLQAYERYYTTINR